MTDIFGFIAELAMLPWYYWLAGFAFFGWVVFYNTQRKFWDAQEDQSKRPWWAQ